MDATKKCPVCNWEIQDGGREAKVQGKVIIVCCDDCAKEVAENPQKFVGTT